MEIIRSTKNERVKEAKRLFDKRGRDETGLFLAEGINLLRDLPESVEVKEVFCTPERSAEIEKTVACTRARVYYMSSDVMSSLSDTVTPYGITAVCVKPERKFALPVGNALLLDGVSDPGNLGTILRTAAAAGFDDVYLLDTADVYSPKVVRATLGALFRVRATEVSEEQAFSLLESTFSVALDMSGENIKELSLNAPVLFVAGSEAHGVREEIKKRAGTLARIDMKNGIESLNAAVAAAIAMYQIF